MKIFARYSALIMFLIILQPVASFSQNHPGKEISQIVQQVPESSSPSGLDEALKTFLEVDSTVDLSVILPVAYDSLSYRVLSYRLRLGLSDADASHYVQDNLAEFGEAALAVTRQFLNKKFANDILYIKEKLEKKLQIQFDKMIEKGRAKRVRIREWLIQ
jgi:hypothetical protein